MYLGAKKYVKHVIEPEQASFNVTKDSEVLSLLKRENPIRVRINKKVEQELTKWRLLIGENKVEEFWKAFRKLSANPMTSESSIYATLESI